MSSWVEINLPWYVHVKLNFPRHPKTNTILEEKFGLNKASEDFKNKWGVSHFVLLSGITNAITDAVNKECPAIGLAALSDMEYQERRIAVFKEKTKHIPGMSEALDIKLLLMKTTAFDEQLPEVIRYRKKCEEIHNKHEEERKNLMFCYNDYCRPGVLIEVENNGEVKQYLIGDINPEASNGVDDYLFNNESIVRRAKIVWSGE